jgi:hypothetical protein
MQTTQKLDLTEAQKLSDAVRAGQARLSDLVDARDAKILELNQAGMPPRQLANVFDMTEGRVYQILRAGKNAGDGHLGGGPARFTLGEDGTPARAHILTEEIDGFTLDDVEL